MKPFESAAARCLEKTAGIFEKSFSKYHEIKKNAFDYHEFKI